MKRFIVAAVMGMSAVAVLAADETAPAKVLEWKFDDNTKDSSTLGNDGAANGAVGYVEGRFGKALSRSAGAVVSKAAAKNLPLKASDPWSMNIWLKASGVPGWSQICGFRDDSSQWGSCRFITNENGFNFWAHNALLGSGVNFADDKQWHMYTLTWNGSRMRMFIDGEFKKAGKPQTVDFAGLADIQQANVAVGDSVTAWAGAVDEFTIWKGALTDEQVGTLYAKNTVEAVATNPATAK